MAHEDDTAALIAGLGDDLRALFLEANPTAQRTDEHDGNGALPSRGALRMLARQTSRTQPGVKSWGKQRLEQELCDAIESGDVSAVDTLLSKGASATTVGLYNQTALHLAVCGSSLPIVELLLDKGADPNAQEKFGHTPLHWACNHGNADAVRAILRHNPDLKLQDDNGATALHTAAVLGNLQIVLLLLDAGADVNAQDHIQSTPLHYVAEAPSSSFAEFAAGNVTRALLEAGAQPQARNAVGNTPMHRACRTNQFDVAWVLLAFMADSNVVNDEGLTPKDLALKAGHERLALLFDK